MESPTLKKLERNRTNEGEWSERKGDPESAATEAESTNIFKEEGSTREIQPRSKEGQRIKRSCWDVTGRALFMTLRRVTFRRI